MNYIPYVLEKSSNGERSYDIFSRLLQDRIILLTGEINDNVSSIIVSELLYLDSLNSNDINIYISSPGGSIVSGLAIYDTINMISSKVNTIVIGMAASMAAFILAAGTGKRKALPNAEIMIHQPYGGMEGGASDIDIQAKRLLRTKERINQLLAIHCKKDVQQIEKDTERDYYMNAKEALDYNLIDEIIEKY